ncbi:family 16 glycosylhydrolase [Salinarimonas sp.]|uniref:family 16 glycosylhydrolase n=1 Tax=Salinarimonas sp. TaxID=2766526 RepID=UPI00391D8BBC
MRIPISRTTCLALALVTVVSAPALARDEATRTGGSFLETFADERLDRERWFVADGWVDTPDFDCAWSADALRKVGDTLEFRIERRPTAEREFMCAQVQSVELFHHGVFEARLRAAEGSGLMSAFFTYTGPYFGDPHDEIDIELPGARTRTVELNSWRDGSDGDGAIRLDVDFDVSAEFRDYAFEWTQDAVRFFVDGEQVGEITDAARIPQAPGKIYIVLYSGRARYDPWLGRFEEQDTPPTMVVERVAFTAPGDDCQFPESIVCGRER